MRKSPSGMVAVVVLLGCWSQSEAGDGTSAKLMRDLAPEGADEGNRLPVSERQFGQGIFAPPFAAISPCAWLNY